MTFKELKNICQPLAVSGSKPEALGALRRDSRAVEKADVFIAVKGTQVDGHTFIDDAIQSGASVIICEGSIASHANVCIIKVENTRPLVGPLAQAFEGNPQKKLRLIGITGTNGKTTIATLTYQVLRKMNARPSLLGTVEKRINEKKRSSRLTTADPIELAGDMRRMVEAGSDFLVMEVSSHALDQQRVAGIDFEAGVFTNLSHDHLDYHTSVEAYAAAKKRLFDGLKSSATAIINADDEYGLFMTDDCDAEICAFGFHKETDITCRLIESSDRGLKLMVDGVEISSPLVGRFNAYNVAETFLICRALGFDDPRIAKALHTGGGAAGRLERVQLADRPNQPLVLVDYAHTPAALKNVLQSLRETKTEGMVLHVIFGCGGDRDRTKRPEMAAIAEQYADRVTITSDNPRSEDPETIIDDAMEGFTHPEEVNRIANRREAIEQAIAASEPHHMILIAGKGHETYQEINDKRRPFDDREVARQALAQRNGNPQTPEVC